MMNISFSLKDKVALVTGATGHLGKEIAFALAQAGAHVILNGRNPENINKLILALRNQNLSASAWVADITQFEEVEKSLPDLLNKQKRLDILVNNAYTGKSSTFDTASLEDYTKAYDITVLATHHLIKSSLPFLKIGGASIINISSMYALVSPDHQIYGNSGFNNPPFYGAAKAGLTQLTKYLACLFAPDRIRVNSLSPGPFPPESLEKDHPAFFESLCQKIPMKRVGLSHEIQGPILFLASDSSSFVTGTDLRVDGGWTAW